MKLRAIERDTILAALRWWQTHLRGDLNAIPQDLWDIATNDGKHLPMTMLGIDNLCADLREVPANG